MRTTDGGAAPDLAAARDCIAASKAVAEVLYYKPSNRKKNRKTTFKYRAEKIRADLKYFAVHRTLPVDKRGCGTSNPSRIHSPEFQDRCRRVISRLAKTQGSKEWSARDFRSALMKDMREDGSLPEGRGISTKTICYFLRYLDMELVEPKKGIYKDGVTPSDPPPALEPPCTLLAHCDVRTVLRRARASRRRRGPRGVLSGERGATAQDETNHANVRGAIGLQGVLWKGVRQTWRHRAGRKRRCSRCRTRCRDRPSVS